MKPRYLKGVCFLTVLVVTLQFKSVAQVNTTKENSESKSPLNVPAAVPQVQEAVRKVLDDSGRSFREGMIAVKVNRRSDSGFAFDRSIETFLMSTLDIQRDKRLQSCYNQLIETVYRIEFPNANQPPQIRSLSATCGWKWTEADLKLADEVAAISKTLKPAASTVSTTGSKPAYTQPEPSAVAGSNGQDFEPSPLDELSWLELTSEELGVESYRVGIEPIIAKAKAGDTVAKLATRNGADPTEVAKFNGLMPNSVLGAGREVEIPRGSLRPAVCGDSPPIQKLRLGMLVPDAEKSLGINIDVRKKRLAFFEDITSGAAIKSLAGTKGVFVSFYKGKVYRISVYYDSSIRWNGIDEFANAISKSLELPKTWISNLDESGRVLRCTNFVLQIDQYDKGLYSLVIEDPAAYAAMIEEEMIKQKRLMLEQERKKREFRP